ncbi:hypothetical protein EXIGLDRAFT_816946 [Exidia glandulosa HHB12029]|uniref:CCHC-type domain-containing protein n=1 Tax=Exidia glandulosa HHB12029 TaxID=1314781 RepID=A0A165KI26_EXIGL|nr:hypothetical protein EXIGLDRAFT_816946 [Exidia glandulosa HHB12029]
MPTTRSGKESNNIPISADDANPVRGRSERPRSRLGGLIQLDNDERAHALSRRIDRLSPRKPGASIFEMLDLEDSHREERPESPLTPLPPEWRRDQDQEEVFEGDGTLEDMYRLPPPEDVPHALRMGPRIDFGQAHEWRLGRIDEAAENFEEHRVAETSADAGVSFSTAHEAGTSAEALEPQTDERAQARESTVEQPSMAVVKIRGPAHTPSDEGEWQVVREGDTVQFDGFSPARNPLPTPFRRIDVSGLLSGPSVFKDWFHYYTSSDRSMRFEPWGSNSRPVATIEPADNTSGSTTATSGGDTQVDPEGEGQIAETEVSRPKTPILQSRRNSTPVPPLESTTSTSSEDEWRRVPSTPRPLKRKGVPLWGPVGSKRPATVPRRAPSPLARPPNPAPLTPIQQSERETISTLEYDFDFDRDVLEVFDRHGIDSAVNFMRIVHPTLNTAVLKRWLNHLTYCRFARIEPNASWISEWKENKIDGRVMNFRLPPEETPGASTSSAPLPSEPVPEWQPDANSYKANEEHLRDLCLAILAAYDRYGLDGAIAFIGNQFESATVENSRDWIFYLLDRRVKGIDVDILQVKGFRRNGQGNWPKSYGEREREPQFLLPDSNGPWDTYPATRPFATRGDGRVAGKQPEVSSNPRATSTPRSVRFADETTDFYLPSQLTNEERARYRARVSEEREGANSDDSEQERILVDESLQDEPFRAGSSATAPLEPTTQAESARAQERAPVNETATQREQRAPTVPTTTPGADAPRPQRVDLPRTTASDERTVHLVALAAQGADLGRDDPRQGSTVLRKAATTPRAKAAPPGGYYSEVGGLGGAGGGGSGRGTRPFVLGEESSDSPGESMFVSGRARKNKKSKSPATAAAMRGSTNPDPEQLGAATQTQQPFGLRESARTTTRVDSERARALQAAGGGAGDGGGGDGDGDPPRRGNDDDERRGGLPPAPSPDPERDPRRDPDDDGNGDGPGGPGGPPGGGGGGGGGPGGPGGPPDPPAGSGGGGGGGSGPSGGGNPPPPPDPSSSGSSGDDSDADNDDRRRQRELKERHRLASQMKMKQPRVYDGRADLDVFDQWCYEVDTWKRLNGIKTKWIIPLLSSFLSDKASRWYMHNVVLSEENWTMRRFYDELFDHCFPSDFKLLLRKRFARATQGNRDVREYARDLKVMSRRFPDVNERQLIQVLWEGVHKYIRVKWFEYGFNIDENTYDDLVSAAEQFEKAERARTGEDRNTKLPERLTGPRGDAAPKREFRPWRRSATPAARPTNSAPTGRIYSNAATVKPKLQANRAGFQRPRGQSSNSGNRPGSRPGPGMRQERPRDNNILSAAERERLSNEGKCFQCKEVGHFSRNCPSRQQARKPSGIAVRAARLEQGGLMRVNTLQLKGMELRISKPEDGFELAYATDEVVKASLLRLFKDYFGDLRRPDQTLVIGVEDRFTVDKTPAGHFHVNDWGVGEAYEVRRQDFSEGKVSVPYILHAHRIRNQREYDSSIDVIARTVDVPRELNPWSKTRHVHIFVNGEFRLVTSDAEGARLGLNNRRYLLMRDGGQYFVRDTQVGEDYHVSPEQFANGLNLAQVAEARIIHHTIEPRYRVSRDYRALAEEVWREREESRNAGASSSRRA